MSTILLYFFLGRDPSPRVGQRIEIQEGGRSFRKRVLTQGHLHFQERVYMYIVSVVNCFVFLKGEGNMATIRKNSNRKVELIITCPIFTNRRFLTNIL